MKRVQITVDLPAHLREWFLSIMSCSAEQTYMECYHDHDFSEGKFVTFDYPGWNDKIVINEVDDE